ncbi:MAG: malate dehydrogenase [SAR202 cluster bacterium]|nr:malate dehydrogenase [SAR202 cluster bacterium]
MRKKVTVVGAGNVGATTAQRLFERGYMDIVLVDVVEGIPQGKALDIAESGPVLGIDASIVGTNSYAETAGSDIVVVTAGIARKPGMSRDDLLFTNMKIVGSVVQEAIKHSPGAHIIVVSNPLDAMVQHAYGVAKFPKNRVVGMAGVLDTARFRTFLAWELGVSVKEVQAYVLGGHGDQMVPLTHYTSVGGVTLAEMVKQGMLTQERLDAVIKRTQTGGGEIVNLLKTGSAFYAPSAATAEMVDAILLDQKRLLPCAALLEGEYGIKGIYMGVPVILGVNGIEKVLELKLTDSEAALLKKSADAVHELVEAMKKAPAA